ncbi:MAG: SGNH/GDSL hydrolase family protein [Bdellovibrionota bacterium]
MKWFSLLFVFLPLLLLEGLLRLAPEPRIAAHVIYDSVLGFRGPPRAAVVTPPSTLRYDENGFRAWPPSIAATKIAILGDSLTEAFTIPEEKAFPARLEKLLPARVRSYASGDWGTVQEWLAYRDYAAPWQPNEVVLQFTAINDFMNNSMEMAGRYQSQMDGIRPYLRNGQVTYLHPRLRWLRDHCRIARWISNLAFSSLITRVPPTDPDCHVNRHMRGVELYRVVRSEETQRLMQETTEVLRALRGAVPGRRLLAVFFPNPLELNPKLYAEAVEGQLHACYPQDPRPSPREAERKFFEVMRSAGIEAVSFYDPFAAAVKNGEEPFIFDGHLSARGHELAAELLAKALRKP